MALESFPLNKHEGVGPPGCVEIGSVVRRCVRLRATEAPKKPVDVPQTDADDAIAFFSLEG
jgi:hypothetical protein